MSLHLSLDSLARLGAEQSSLNELLKDDITTHQKESNSFFNLFFFVSQIISEVSQFSQVAT